MYGGDGPDELPEFDGWRPPARRNQIEEFTTDDAAILLDGDGTPGGHGYHRHGLRVKASEFPAGWGVAEVTSWVRGIVELPTWGHATRSGFVLYGTCAGVEGLVQVRREGDRRWVISTAYPQSAVDWPR